MRDHLGLFAGFFQSAMSSMAAAVEGGGLRVGSRRRTRRWSERGGAGARPAGASGGDGYYLVPPERALVPVAASLRRD